VALNSPSDSSRVGIRHRRRRLNPDMSQASRLAGIGRPGRNRPHARGRAIDREVDVQWNVTLWLEME